MRRIQVDESDFAPLDRPVRGEGGFQNLLRRIRAGYDRATETLEISAPDAERVMRYSADYGGGGFQGRLGPLAIALAQPSAE